MTGLFAVGRRSVGGERIFSENKRRLNAANFRVLNDYSSETLETKFLAPVDRRTKRIPFRGFGSEKFLAYTRIRITNCQPVNEVLLNADTVLIILLQFKKTKVI